MKRLFPLLAAMLSACVAPQTEGPPASAAPPHAAYAWVTFDAERITGSGTDGLADREAGRPLTIDDPVRVASISKLVVALGVMRMVEAGELDLDRDVSEWLGWSLRNPAFADRPITLRLLLSHRSSLQDDVDYVIPLDRTVAATLADTRAFDREHPPGTFFRYSNLNFPIIATVMERASNERFDRLIQRRVLTPLALDACYNWTTCSDPAIGRAVVLYGSDGSILRDDLRGAPPPCPVAVGADAACDWTAYRIGTNGALFSPQGGLRISAAGLARLGQLLLRDGQLPDGRPFLSPSSLAAMTDAAWRTNGANGVTDPGFYCAYGLAVQILSACAPGDDPFGDGRVRIGHAGDAYQLRSGLWVDPARRTGIAYFATGVAEDAPRGRSAYRGIEEWLAAREAKAVGAR
ncbi:serine hydrolase [Sphingosinicella sp. BN140058]|uniref:serine hydrolase domain-containing protein n=1 Tax=Sphingosinicella sp. BN140058 TaxID=1892855 RepID=UPI001010FA02|nr:serine hydrolase domain-containing protein [Sphingosinicella sp. BN140058]QAY76747.1 class A beta-lactamase-related serine hydrolase [Sphingosinicella sp. BN140058]